MLKYQIVQRSLKKDIQQQVYQTGDLLPSEHELCAQYQITRTTARKALDELRNEGFIHRLPGIGSKVRERRQSLGLLNVKGFSQAVGQRVRTKMLRSPAVRGWDEDIVFPVGDSEQQANCLHFERLRGVNDQPVTLENNWFADTALPGFVGTSFVDDSFFKTLSQRFCIEIVGSQQELRAETSGDRISHWLKVQPGDPILHISIKFETSHPDLNIYSELYCNTQEYPIGNQYHL